MHFIAGGKRVDVDMRSTLAANDAGAYLSCAVMGLGLIQVPLLLARSHLESGELVGFLQDFQPLPLSIAVAYPRNRHLSSQVRAFVDWNAQRFEGNPLLRRRPGLAAPQAAGNPGPKTANLCGCRHRSR